MSPARDASATNVASLIAIAALSCFAEPAVAQTPALPIPGVGPAGDPATSEQGTDQPPAPVAAQPVSQLPVNTATGTPTQFQRYDALAMRGWERPLPKSGDTLIGDKLGIRDTLADAGIGFIGFASNAIQYNFLQNDHGYKGPQLYNAQRFTRMVSNAAIFATYDLGRIGIKDGQFIFSALYTSNSFNRADGPNDGRIGRLAWDQRLANGRVEFKIGYFDNGFEFLGTQTGGSLAGGTLGPQASVPNEVGLSYSGFSSPAADIRINFKNHFYTKLGVQRSLPPGGALIDAPINKIGLRFTEPNTGVLTIGEFGWDRSAQAGTMGTWFRAGGIYNTTNFNRFGGGRTSDNWAAYAALDRQVVQIDPLRPARGLYLGATFNYAPKQQNFVSQYYEGRVYGIGLVKSRPFDLASLVATANVYSKDGLIARTAASGASYYKETYSAIASYAYRLTPGFYIQPGLGVVVHPVYSPRFPAAFNGYLTATFFL